jgi:hypothetical protein
MRLRHVAWPKALKSHPVFEIVKAVRKTPLKLVRPHHHLQLAAETL